MSLEELFIKNKNEYIEMKETLSNIFKFNQSMPNQVFHKEYNSFLFGEYHGMFEEGFWKELQILARKADDKYIILAEVENYYNERMDRYEWVKIPIELSYEHYLDILNIEPFEGDYIGLVDYGCKLVFTSPSLKWGILGERDHEMYVFACKENFKSKFKEPPLTVSFQLNEALVYIISIYSDKKKASLFCEELLKNYQD